MVRNAVLLVEDEQLIALASKLKLEKYGYTVTLASSGEKAIEMLKALENGIISIVLMDIDLGKGLNGVDTAKEILRIIDIPIIFVSSHTESEIIALAQSVTGYGYLVKSSSVIVYDTAIKMATRLFDEKVKNEIYASFVTTALEKSSEPFFICNTTGDIEFFNNEYMKIQGITDPNQIEKRFEMYNKQIMVFSEEGELLSSDNIASTRALKGESGNNIVFHVYNISIKMLISNEYTYAPVFYKNRIVGSYVKIGKSTDIGNITAKDRIEKIIHLTIPST